MPGTQCTVEGTQRYCIAELFRRRARCRYLVVRRQRRQRCRQLRLSFGHVDGDAVRLGRCGRHQRPMAAADIQPDRQHHIPDDGRSWCTRRRSGLWTRRSGHHQGNGTGRPDDRCDGRISSRRDVRNGRQRRDAFDCGPTSLSGVAAPASVQGLTGAQTSLESKVLRMSGRYLTLRTTAMSASTSCMRAACFR